MKPHKYKLYIKIIELDKIENFVVDKFIIWDLLEAQICILAFQFKNPNFWIF
jgi:hypothetical protein